GTGRGRLIGHAGAVTCVGFAPDGRWAFSGGQDGVYIWSLETGKLLRRLTPFPAAVLAVGCLSDTRILVGLADATVRSLSLETLREGGSWTVPVRSVVTMAIEC